ncbi:Uncharacterized protein Adt_22727 [Abeliophyllum distichum]|uniref:Uncharacterized protein n=1 Tax=Abeliophyllum distichum TaxID=126358 RepID=A0ABD1S8X5_9LAMI
MEYAHDRRLCEFTRKVTANCNITNIKKAENALDDHHKAELHRSCFWNFHQVRCMQFSGQIIDNLLLRLVKSENGESVLLIQNDYISMWQKKLAADLYTQNYDP